MAPAPPSPPLPRRRRFPVPGEVLSYTFAPPPWPALAPSPRGARPARAEPPGPLGGLCGPGGGAHGPRGRGGAPEGGARPIKPGRPGAGPGRGGASSRGAGPGHTAAAGTEAQEPRWAALQERPGPRRGRRLWAPAILEGRPRGAQHQSGGTGEAGRGTRSRGLKRDPAGLGSGGGAASVEGKTQSAQRQSPFGTGKGACRGLEEKCQPERALGWKRDADWQERAEPPLCTGRDLGRAETVEVTVRVRRLSRGEREPASAGGGGGGRTGHRGHGGVRAMPRPEDGGNLGGRGRCVFGWGSCRRDEKGMLKGGREGGSESSGGACYWVGFFSTLRLGRRTQRPQLPR